VRDGFKQHRQCTNNVTLWHVHKTTVAVEKAISITYSKYVFVALGIQYAMQLRHIIICGLSGCNVFPHISLRAQLKKKSLRKQTVCFDFLYNFCLKHFSFYEKLSKIWSKMYIGLHVKYPLSLSYIHETNFLDRFSKIFKYQILWKSVQWEPRCSMWKDRQTDTVTDHQGVSTPNHKLRPV
jgi:hypothetical protein